MRVIPVDCNYVEPEFACSYLLVREEAGVKRGFFVECNTNYAIPYLIKAVEKEGLAPDQVDGLIITHVHLDHAGGTGLFLKEFPIAKVYAHPRAAKHVIDPSKLVASATQVYGEAFMQKMYGTILPADPSRVVVLEDGATIRWQGMKFETKHTRGHANHHLCVIAEDTVFTGDSFGVSYPEVRNKRGLVILVSTSPTDFDGAAALASIDWIVSLKKRVALTHFGFIEVSEVPVAAEMLRDQIVFSMEMLKRIQKDHLNEKQVTDQIQSWTIDYFSKRNIMLDAEDLMTLQLDMKVNAQGLVFAANRKPTP